MIELRRQRIERIFQEEIIVLLQSLADDSIPSLTVTEVKIREDARSMNVGYIFSEWLVTRAELEDLPEHKIQKLTRYLRRELMGRTELRSVPEIILRRDRGYENKIRIEEILSASGTDSGPVERSASRP